MHDGTDDPETHPEGNVEDATTDPVVVSENTGSDGENGSSDQQETTDNTEVEVGDNTTYGGDVIPEVVIKDTSNVLSFDEFVITAQDRPEEMISDYSPEKELRDKLIEFHGEESSLQFERGIQFPGFGQDDIIVTNSEGNETRIVLPTRKTDLQDVTYTQAYKEYYKAVTGREFD